MLFVFGTLLSFSSPSFTALYPGRPHGRFVRRAVLDNYAYGHTSLTT